MQYPERTVPMDPYALGLLLGDGCITGTTPSFSTDDPELAEALEDAVPGVELQYRSRVDYGLQARRACPASPSRSRTR